MGIEAIKSAIKTTMAKINEAQNRLNALYTAENPAVDEMNELQNTMAALQMQYDGLQANLAAEEKKQSRNLSKLSASIDSVKSAGEKFKSVGDFMSCVAQMSSGVVDPRMAEYASIRSAASGQNVTTDAEGGYLVPPDYAAELLNVAKSASVLLPEVQRIPIAGNRLIVNELEQTSRTDGNRNGGLLAYWTAEAADYTASKMKYKQSQTDLHKLTGLCYATEEMLEDLPAMSSYISQNFADEFSFKIDDAILNGTGDGMPLGILAQGDSDAKKNKALITIAKESGQAAATVVLNNILKMFNAMPASNRANAKWYINQDLEIVLMQLLMETGSISGQSTGSFGVPLYVPAGGLASAPNGMLLGRPIVPVEQCAALGTAGDIVLADMSQYRWIDKGGINAETSVHVRFVQDEQAFKFTYRCGGRPIWSNPITAFKGTTERSPYIALADRT